MIVQPATGFQVASVHSIFEFVAITFSPERRSSHVLVALAFLPVSPVSYPSLGRAAIAAIPMGSFSPWAGALLREAATRPAKGGSGCRARAARAPDGLA